MSKSHSKTLLRLTLSISVVFAAIYFSVSGTKVSSAGTPTVVVNKYFNSGTTADIVELLVIQNNLDMRGMILKDFSSSMANDGGGKYQFTTNALWSSLPAGTLIVLRNNNSAADTAVGGGDFNLDLGLQSTTYFSSAGGTFDIAGIEEVMIKAAGSGAAGVTGSIHALAGGTAGAQFTATAAPKLIATGQSGTNQFVFANNGSQNINDFDGTDATGAAAGLTFGAGNNANNTAYINSLRGGTNFTLNVSRTGSGSVTSSPSGINCGLTCSASYTSGTSVTLTAAAAAGSTFAGWSGACTGTGTCTVSMTANRSVSAAFTAVTQTLNVSKTGTGTGTVTSSPAGINCGATCSADYNSGTLVTLTAAADVNSTFTSWSGCDSVSGNTCNVTLNATGKVTATFTSTQRVLTVNRTGTGTGTVTSSPSGINCGATCVATYADNTSVTLTATAALSSTFGGWIGCDSVSGNACTVTMNANKTVSSTFNFTPTPPGAVVISQIYGGGGNGGATYKNDFIELFNRSSNAVDLSGWTVQYNSATGTGSWSGKTALSGIIPAGGYYLVKESQGSGGTVDLPTPDATGTITMAAGAGKVALVINSTTLSGCPSGASIIDLVGYGATANCSEGNTPTPTLGNTIAAIRTHGGCKDTDVNGLDFKTGPASPRNGSTALHFCPAGDLEPEVFSNTPNDGATSIPLASNITVQFDEPVNVSGAWFGLTCSLSGTHTATVTGGPTTFTINPDIDFATLEQCTVTIYASNVTDQDSIDPPDNMAADYTWTFLTGHDPQVNLTMGNPSNATADVNNADNYLMEKDQYSLSYNRSKATPNWVSWQLDQTWLGSTQRQDTFRADDTLPADWYHVLETDFQFSTYGFDRGHMCPSADRTATVEDNSNTFLMTNMVPQASGNNQGPWAGLESYLRSVVTSGGNRIYIISGPAGTGGLSSTGSWNTINTPTGGAINIPSATWKVALVLPVGNNDILRVDNSTRTIAVIMPNNDNIRPDTWQKYLATVRQVESLSGYNFYSNVPTSIQDVIEPKLDVTNDTAPQAMNQTATTNEDNAVTFTLTGTDFNVNNVLSFSAVSAPAHGTLEFDMPNCPASLTQAQCTVNVTYTPAANYNGADSFTFKVNDGGLDSNTATVNLTVNPVNDPPAASNQSVTTDSNTPVSITLTGSDVETTAANLVFAVTSGAGNGSLSGTAPNVVYTPATNFCGTDKFRFTVTDSGDGSSGPLTSSEGTISITVKDKIAPTITTPANMTRTAAPGADSAVVNFTVTASDSCGGVTVESSPASGSVFGLGVTTVQITATDDAGNVSTSSFTVTVKATSSVAVNCLSSETYTGAAIEPCTATVTGAGGLNQSVPVTYSDNVSVGIATANASYSGDANHEASSGSTNFTITKASSTTTVNCPASQTYTGAAIEPCTASYSGAGGLSGALTPTYLNNLDAGSATASATFGGDANHEGSTGNSGFTINKASSTTTVTCPASQAYTGAALTPCSVTVTGANLSLTPGASYANNTSAGTATASYTFAGDANHDGSSDSKNFEITKANATISVTPYNVQYDGNPHTATGTATGVNGESLSGLDLSGTTHTSAGTYNGDPWTFTDGTGNYNNTGGTANDTISQASASLSVNGYTGVHDGSAHGANGSATGVNGENLTSLLNLGASFTNVPGGTAHWTFAGNTNYAPASGDATITISKATPVITWSNPADIVYGTALGAAQLNATANVAGSFNYAPGSGTVLNAGAGQPLLASFTPTDSTNYNPTSKTVMIKVLKATPAFSILSSPVITYGTASTNLSGKISFGSLIPSGSVAITLNGVTQNTAIQAGGNFSSSFATGSLAAGSDNIAYSYGGDSNFNSASDSGTLTVGYNIVPLYDQTKLHQSGSTIPIKLQITGANGNNLSSAGTVVTAVGIALVSTSVYGPVDAAGNANPDNNFRFAGDSYIFNMKTTGMGTGVYNLYFKVGADPTLHTMQFQIK